MNPLSTLPEEDARKLGEFLSDEDIIAKAQALEHTERQYRYQRLGGTPGTFWKRLLRAAENVPEEHCLGLVALACNVVYLPTPIVDGILRELARDLRRRLTAESITNDAIQILSVDDPGLLGDLYRLGDRHGFTNRVDQTQGADFPTLKHLLRALLALPGLPMPQRRQAAALFRKRARVFLADNVLSGTSAASDLKRAGELLGTFSLADTKPQLFLCAQIITSQALRRLSAADVPPHVLVKGIEFDDRFRINDPRSPDKPNLSCELFNQESTLERVCSFCRWFGETHFPFQEQLTLAFAPQGQPARPDLFAHSLQAHRGRGYEPEFVYGWADTGLTLVLETNCPNNSVPPLWFPDLDNSSSFRYVAPFSRSSSRADYTPSETAELHQAVLQSSQSIAEAIRG